MPLLAASAQSAFGAATVLRKLADNEVSVGGRAVKIQCDAKEENGVDEAFGEKILQERDDSYETLKLITAKLIREESEGQGLPLDEIEKENQTLADMNDARQEEIDALSGALEDISADMEAAQRTLANGSGFFAKIKNYQAIADLTARKKELVRKISELSYVKIQLEEGIKTNDQNSGDLRIAIATAFKTKEMGELESKIAMGAAYYAKAVAFCKSKSKYQKPFEMPQIEGGVPLGPFGPCIKGGCTPRPADGPLPAVPQPKPVRRCLPAAGGRAVCFDEYGMPSAIPNLPS